MKVHQDPCKFTGNKYGLIFCDQGEHEQSFCITCGVSLPHYLHECFDCENASLKVPYLSQTLASLRRTLVLEQRNKGDIDNE